MKFNHLSHRSAAENVSCTKVCNDLAYFRLMNEHFTTYYIVLVPHERELEQDFELFETKTVWGEHLELRRQGEASTDIEITAFMKKDLLLQEMKLRL